MSKQLSLFSSPPAYNEGDVVNGKRVVRTRHGDLTMVPVNNKTLATFVSQANAVWNGQYDYTDSVLTNMKEPITIYCPGHDLHFRVAMAQNHIMKHNATGCPVCRYEKQHGQHYGPEWRDTLRLSAKQNRVGLIRPLSLPRSKTPEQIAAEKAERERQRQEREKVERDYMAKYHAKSMPEARFCERVQQQYGYDTSLVDYKGREVPVTLICQRHGMFEITPRLLLCGDKRHKQHGCWKCAGLPDPRDYRPLTTAEIYRRLEFKFRSSRLIFQTKRKLSMKVKLSATCPKHGQQTHAVETWLRGTGCDYCEGRKFWWPDFERLAREKHGDKYDYSKVVPQKALKDEVTIICPTHGEFRQRADMHLDGWGCKQCSGYPNKKSPEQRCQEWISKCIDKYGPDRYDYSRAHEDYVNNDSLVWIRCCIHDHWFRQTPDNNLRTVNGSCPICSAEFTETQGEAAIRRWLLKHGITNFKQDEVTIEHHNPRCRRQYLRPDFWLPDYNLFIEYNGEQHYEEIDYFNTDDWTFQDQQIRDETLRQYCADPKHFHHLLEIPYWDYSRIDEILTAELKPKC